MDVTKVDAARRQLDTAIEMFFQSGDAVAIHTLAAASYEVITALRARMGQPDETLAEIVPEYRGEFRRLWNKAQNFFKHADREDADAVLEFNTSLTEGMMFLASHRFAWLQPKTPQMVIFMVWFSVHQPSVISDPRLRATLHDVAHWKDISRESFWKQMKEAVPAARS